MEVYNLIAKEWNEYKQKPLPVAELLLRNIEGKTVLDCGTGNGRHLPLLLEKFEKVYAVDSSEKLLEIAKNKYSKVRFQLADICALPFPENSFDVILCTAVLHHLTAEEAVLAFNELFRVLKSNGLLLASVWNRHQQRFEKITGNEAMIEWKMKNGTIAKRYVHFFEKEEIEKLAVESGFEVVKLFYELNGNEHKRSGVCDSDTSFACAEEHEKSGAGNLCLVARKVLKSLI